MKKTLLALVVTFSLILTSCNIGGSDPKTVLSAFFDAMEKKDFDGAKKLATKDSEQMFSLMQMGMNMNKDKDSKMDIDKFDKTKMVIGDAKIDGDKATVPVKVSGESTNFILKKESGSWKVAFDKASVMQMGMDKMKEKGINPSSIMDSVNNGLDKLKNINTDSLSGKMKDALDKLKNLQQQNPDAAQKMQDALKKLEDAAEKAKQ